MKRKPGLTARSLIKENSFHVNDLSIKLIFLFLSFCSLEREQSKGKKLEKEVSL